MQNYLQPAVGQQINIPIPGRHRFVPNMVVFHQYGGYYRVAEGTTPTNLKLINLGIESARAYPFGYSNPLPGTLINNLNAIIQPAGELGNDGDRGYTGAQGVQGVQGLKGDPGETGKVTAGYMNPGSGAGGIGGTCGPVKCGYDARNVGIRVCKPAHGFVAGQVLRVSTNYLQEWELADATNFESAAAVGIVQCVVNDDQFVLIMNGRVEFLPDAWPLWAPDGLFPGAIYYLSDTPGELSLVPGTETKALFIGYTEDVGFFNTYSAGSGGGGVPGKNAFTFTTSTYVQPVANQDVTVQVADSSFAALGQVLFVEDGGYYLVISKPTSTSLTLRNIDYPGNAAGGTGIIVNRAVSPAGLIGPQGPQGIQGNQGVPGNQGNPGADGKSVLNGSGVPSSGLGTNGDFYIDTTADDIYGPKTGGVWGSPTSLIGPQGPAGSTGAAGKTVLNGAGVPSSGLGTNGDFYINTSANTIYGPKTAGAWGSPTSLVGPQGPTGNTGPQGIPGLNSIGTFVEIVNNKEYVLDVSAAQPYTVTSLTAQLGAGTCTVTYYKNGVAIGASALNATTTKQTVNFTNAFIAMDKLSIAVTSNSGGLDLAVSLALS